MNKNKKREDEVFEIIELSISDIDLLKRAFEVIEQACADETTIEKIDISPTNNQILIH